MNDRHGKAFQTKDKEITTTRYERTFHITEITVFSYDLHRMQLAKATEGYREGDRSQILQAVVCHEKKLGLYPKDIGWKEEE